MKFDKLTITARKHERTFVHSEMQYAALQVPFEEGPRVLAIVFLLDKLWAGSQVRQRGAFYLHTCVPFHDH